jgi:heme/copper-type cytochrome/quinol oxidase subunit 3
MPTVSSRHPLWDRETAPAPDDLGERVVEALDHRPEGWRATILVDVITGRPQAIARLATPSYWPFVTALGVVLVTVATIAKLFLLVPVGALISVAALIAWLWPNRKELDLMRISTLPEEIGLPIFTTGSKSLGWLGLLFLMAVLGWSFGTLLYTYFYLRLYSTEWPQGNLPLPELVRPALLYAAIPLAAGACGAAWYFFRWGMKLGCVRLLAVGCILMSLFLAFHAHQLSQAGFTPQTNAYGSIFFVLSWGVDVLVLIGLGLAGTALVRTWREDQHWRIFLTLHMQMTAHYGYFAAAVAVVVYGTLYLSPYAI